MASNHKYSIPDTNYIIKRIHRPKYQEEKCFLVLRSRMERFSAFCNSTSLHGWPHIPGSSTMGRIFWAVTILAMAAVAIYLCSRFSTEVTFINTTSHQHREAVHNLNSVDQPCLLYRTNRPCHLSQSGHLQQIPTQVCLYTRDCCVLMIEKVFNRLNLLFNNSNLKEIIHGLFGCKFEHFAKRSKQLHRR